MSIDFPMSGTLFRPVGGYCYCLEVVRAQLVDDNRISHWAMRRWGIDDKCQPYQDGGPPVTSNAALRYLTGLKRIAPGVWKDEPDRCGSWHGPLYYRQMDVGGQMELFA